MPPAATIVGISDGTKEVHQSQPLNQQKDAATSKSAISKTKIHKDGLLKQLLHLDEIVAGFWLLVVRPIPNNARKVTLKDFDALDLDFCDMMLGRISRSFAAVIRQFPPRAFVDFLVFYLVLRALDTVEDDMTYFDTREKKVEELFTFTKNALGDPDWSMDGIGEGEERRLLEEWPRCHKIFASLSVDAQKIIRDITSRMAEGMAEFVLKDQHQGPEDVLQYNRYCHFVAGLSGEGAVRMFAAAGLEAKATTPNIGLINDCGLLLQKHNIIVDFAEDLAEDRVFWPQTVWKKYSLTGRLDYFQEQSDPTARALSLQCLNEMITDVLEYIPSGLEYISQLQSKEAFRFCAIPQVAAFAGLSMCYNNPNVFTGSVKIRKGYACKLILQTTDFSEVVKIYDTLAKSIMTQAIEERRKGVVDPSFLRTVRACREVVRISDDMNFRHRSYAWTVGVTATFVAVAWFSLNRRKAIL